MFERVWRPRSLFRGGSSWRIWITSAILLLNQSDSWCSTLMLCSEMKCFVSLKIWVMQLNYFIIIDISFWNSPVRRTGSLQSQRWQMGRRQQHHMSWRQLTQHTVDCNVWKGRPKLRILGCIIFGQGPRWQMGEKNLQFHYYRDVNILELHGFIASIKYTRTCVNFTPR